jgi:hypothetical protein
MRTLVAAAATAALLCGLVAQTIRAGAVTGYDSSYAGESAFLTLGRGATGSFTVFFANTGATSWVRGGASQVDLAACRDDKLTCDAQDTSEAAFNSGWRSPTRYATHTQASVAPGAIGTFTYSVAVPATAAAGTYRFNGAVVLASSGADLHNEGYFQDVTVEVAAAAATLTDLDPVEGSVEGGDTVTITGTGFDCSPEPQALFGDAAGDVFACSTTSLSVETPEHAAGTVDVTVVNAGSSASNALPFEFVDDVRPTFESIAPEGQTVTLRFSEPVCADNGTLTADTEIRVRVNGADVTESGISFADCGDDEFADTGTLSVTQSVSEGDEVSVTITTTGADDIFDESDNAMDAGATRTEFAEADETDPVLESATASDEQTLEVVFSEPVECDGTDRGQFVFDPDESGEDDVTASDVDCDGSDTVTLDFPTDTFAGGVTGALEYTADDDPIADPSGNRAANASVAIVPSEADEPTIEDAFVSASAGLRNSADDDDEITIVFSENMNSTTTSDLIRVLDADGTIADIKCTSLATADNDVFDAECDYDGDELVITLLEDPAGEVIADGDTPGVQWPAEIIDTSNIKDQELNDVDLDNSDDVTIDFE